MKKTILSVIIVAILAVGLMANEKEDQKKIEALYKEGKLQEALTAIDAAIDTYGATEGWLSSKYYLLMDMKKYPEAMDTAIKKVAASERKSPWRCIDVTKAAILAGKNDVAFKYLEKAVQRKFNDISELEDKAYDPIRGDKRFAAIAKKVRDLIGLDKTAKDFTLPLLSGEKYTLSKRTGKVVLVDFWAVWCPPCRKDMPHVKKLYEANKEKGFEIIGISLDKNLDKVKKYMEKEGITWNITCSLNGWYDPTVALYNVSSIPSTWLVDKKGVLRYFGLRGEELEKAVAELLAE